jgi:hypothetical protein
MIVKRLAEKGFKASEGSWGRDIKPHSTIQLALADKGSDKVAHKVPLVRQIVEQVLGEMGDPRSIANPAAPVSGSDARDKIYVFL